MRFTPSFYTHASRKHLGSHSVIQTDPVYAHLPDAEGRDCDSEEMPEKAYPALTPHYPSLRYGQEQRGIKKHPPLHPAQTMLLHEH